MKNITLALAIALGFCTTEAEAQTSTRQRQDREFEALILSGDAEQKLKRFEEEASKSWAALDKMLALEEKSKTLSADALAIYKERLDVVKREYETCSNRLAHARAMFTPEKIAEMEKRKIRKQRAEEEYRAFAADVEQEIEKSRREAELAAERAQREKEREEQRAQLLQIQEELRRAREARNKGE